MSTRKIVVGTITGIRLGAVGYYLVSSGKGQQIYNKVVDMGESYANQFKSKLNSGVDAAKEKYSDIMDGAEDLAQKGKAKYENTKKEIKTVSNDFNQLSS